MEELKITRERAIKRMEWILKHEIYCSDKLSHAAINMAITALRSAEPENKALTITLPCKVGDTVYYIAWHEKQPIKRGTVWLFGMDETHVWANITVSKTSVVTMNVDNLYLTREAAEQALSARRPEDAK